MRAEFNVLPASPIRFAPLWLTILSLLLFGMAQPVAHAAQVTFRWDYSASGAAGFVLYCGSSSHNYPTRIDVGNTDTYTLAGLAEGSKYYCAVTAYDAARVESDYSAELPVSIPYTTPSVNFGASPSTGAAPLSVAFTNTTTGQVTTWAWDFGDGTTSTAQNPTHTYSTPGSYKAVLTATGPGGTASKTAATAISVSASAPVVNFSASPTSGIAPLSVTFVNTTSGQVSSWAWNFGDGSTSNLQNPTHVYTTPGSYKATLTATGPGGAASKTAATAVSVSASGGSPADGTAPTVGITAPSTGATVVGTTTVTATASDNVGVVGVQFLLDGAALGAELPGPSFSLSWTTSSVPNGAHTLSARARDAAGNTALSASVSVTVSNTQPLGLVAAYSFNEGTGSAVADVSGNKNNGTLGSGVSWSAQGKFGNALVFNGTNALVTIPDSASLRLTTAMTLEAWVNPSSVSSVWRDVVYKGDDNYYLMATSTNSAMPAARASLDKVYGTGPLAANTWTHLATTYDGATMRLYVNGVQVSSIASTGSMVTSTNPLQIGGDSIYGQYFQGLIDEVRVYNRALTQAQIQTDMATAVSGTPPPTDSTAPTVSITTPTTAAAFTSSTSPLTLAGSAADNIGVTQVSWSNNRGGSGTATGTTAWSMSGIVLQPGANVLTVTARDAANNTRAATLTVTYSDSTTPTVAITAPTAAASFVTNLSPLTLAGSAGDNIGVTQVSWTNNRGGSGTATGTTSWSASGIVLQSGANVLTVTARDAANNTRAATLTVTYSDSTAPTIAITTPTAAASFKTNLSPLTLAGSAADNIGVTQVSWSNNRGGSGTATGTTAWSVSGIALQPGANVLTVTARDAAGNTRAATLTVTYSDSTAPTIAIATPTAAASFKTNLSPLTLAGSAADNVGVTQVSWSNNRGGSGTATGTTAWSVSGIVLQPGANVLTVTARDAANNTRVATLTVTYDPTVPTVAITTPTAAAAFATKSTPLMLAGSAADNIGVTQVSWSNNRGGSGTATGTTAWSVSGIVLQPGANVLTVTARDAANNTRVATLTVNYDPTAPTLAISKPTAAAAFASKTSPLALAGSAADSVGVTQVSWSNNRGGSGTAIGTTAWSVSGIVLQPGANVLTVTARDAANNTRVATLTVTYDPTAPTLAITTPTAAATFATKSTPLTLAGSAADNIGVTQVSWSNNRGGSGTATGTTAWSVSGIVLQPGSNVLTVTARDATNNTRVATLTVTYDPTAPTVKITVPAISATVSGTTTLTATASDNVGVVGVQFLLDGVALGAELPGPSFSLSWATSSVPNGAHTLSARARDATGNTALSASVSVTVSNTQPLGLVAAYSFNEGTGSTVADVSSNRNNGTLGSGVTWSAQGKFGNALVFNGTNALVTIPDSASLRLTTAMTLEAWVNPSSVSSVWRDVVYKGDDNYYLMATSGNNALAAARVGPNKVYGASPLATNTWTHLATTYDGAILRLYVNGVQVSSVAYTGSIATSTNPLQIGGDSIYGQYFQGLIDEVRVYNRALTQAQIQADMNTSVRP